MGDNLEDDLQVESTAESIEDNVSSSEEKVNAECSKNSSSSVSNVFGSIPTDKPTLDQGMEIISKSEFVSNYYPIEFDYSSAQEYLWDKNNTMQITHTLGNYGNTIYKMDTSQKTLRVPLTDSENLQFISAKSYMNFRCLTAIQDHIYRVDENISNTNVLLLTNCLLTGAILFYLGFTTVFKSFFKH